MSRMGRLKTMLATVRADWRVGARDILVEAGNRLLWTASTDWEHNGEMRTVEDVLAGQPSPVVIDVGANTGSWATSLLRRFPQAQVHSFEPIPDFYALIPELPGLTKHNFGLGDSDNPTVYYQVDGGGSEVAAKAATGRNSVMHELPRRHAASAIADLGIAHTDFVKIDVDGSEFAVLVGLRSILERDRPPVQFEFGHFNYANGDSFYRFGDFFNEVGYRLELVRPHSRIAVNPYRAITAENPCNLNYLASPAH